MNCDQVFDILTRGPFPTGHASDRDVEAHLARCGDCYRLAEALRPAVELFEESIARDLAGDLPGYWGELRPAPARVGAKQIQVVRRAAPALAALEPTARSAWRRAWDRPAVRVSTALGLGVVLAVLLRMAGLSEKPAAWQTAAAAPAAAPAKSMSPEPPLFMSGETDSPIRAVPASLQLAPACFGIQPLYAGKPQPTIELAQGRSLVDYNQLQCCTQCHHQGQKQSAPHAIAAVAQSCATCHP